MHSMTMRCYGSAGPIRLAFERAEVNFTQETSVGISRSVLPWMREGWTSVLYQVGFVAQRSGEHPKKTLSTIIESITCAKATGRWRLGYALFSSYLSY
jgi:hypothetical protein